MRLLWITAILTFVLDQLTKFAVVQALDLARLGSYDVLPPFLNFRMAWNTGINFGLLADNGEAARWVLIAVAILISIGVIWWTRREQPRPIGMVAAGLVVGGAMGNVVDRVVYGAVADFVNMSCCGIVNPFSFNVADAAIFVGAAMLVFLPAEKEA